MLEVRTAPPAGPRAAAQPGNHAQGEGAGHQGGGVVGVLTHRHAGGANCTTCCATCSCPNPATMLKVGHEAECASEFGGGDAGCSSLGHGRRGWRSGLRTNTLPFNGCPLEESLKSHVQCAVRGPAAPCTHTGAHAALFGGLLHTSLSRILPVLRSLALLARISLRSMPLSTSNLQICTPRASSGHDGPAALAARGDALAALLQQRHHAVPAAVPRPAAAGGVVLLIFIHIIYY